MDLCLNNTTPYTPEELSDKTLSIAGPGNLVYEVSFNQEEEHAPLEIAITGRVKDGTMQDFVLLKANPDAAGVEVFVFADKATEDASHSFEIPLLDELKDAAKDDFQPWEPATKVIGAFTDEFWFLSNFTPSPILYDGLLYQNAEAAFQASKCTNVNARKAFCLLNPSDAKKMGRHVPLRSDWETVKNSVMYNVVKNKFSQNPDLLKKLQATGDAILIEGNYWHDNYWGSCSCNRCVTRVGKNTLGKILMKVRAELSSEEVMGNE